MRQTTMVRLRVAAILALLAAGWGLTTWKMLDYRQRLHDLTDNRRWEQTVMATEQCSLGPVVFFGDSQIAFWELAPSFGALPAINRGVPGDWATLAVQRFDDDVLAHNPRCTVILMGANDLANSVPPAKILDSIGRMVRSAREAGSAVILCSVLPVRGLPVQQKPHEHLTALNDGLRVVAQAQGADFVDLYTPLRDSDNQLRPEFTVDGLHPSRRGYLEMTQVLLPHLLQALASPPKDGR